MLSINHRFKSAALALFLGANLCVAGGEAGNGGDALVCRDKDNQITSVEFFDVYEARELRKMIPDLGDPKLSPTEKVESMLKSIEGISPTRAALYRKWLSTFFAEAKFLVGKTLEDIPDAGPIFYPKECGIEQLIVFREPLFPEDGSEKYLINKDLWDHLDNDNIAVAISHELVYREFTTIVNHPNSVRARYFNSFLFSRKLGMADYKDFTQIHVRSQAGYIDIHGVLAQINLLDKKYSPYSVSTEGKFKAVPVKFHSDGRLYSAYVLNWDYVLGTAQENLSLAPFDHAEQAKAIREGYHLPEYSYLKSGKQKMAIYGQPAEATNAGLVFFYGNGRVYTFSIPYFQADYMEEEGSSSRFEVKLNEKNSLNLLGLCSIFYGPIEVAIHPDGSLRSYESERCAMRPTNPLKISFQSKKGEEHEFLVESHSFYPGSALNLHFFDGAPNLAYVPTGTHKPARVTRKEKVVFEGYKIRYWYDADYFASESAFPKTTCGPKDGFRVDIPALQPGQNWFFITATEGGLASRELECLSPQFPFETTAGDGLLFSCGYKGNYLPDQPVITLTGSGDIIRHADFYSTTKRTTIECH